MGSETEDNDLEVKKVHTRTRSKPKQEKAEEFLTSSNNQNDTVHKSSNGTITKQGRAKRSRQTMQEVDKNAIRSKETTDMEESKKAKQRKRSGNKKNSSKIETDAKDCTHKRLKKDGINVDDKEESIDNEEDNDDSKKPKKPSKRQLKREKAEQRESMKKEASKLEATEKALNYVSKWKHARSEWKFEKLRQIWLMDNLLDEKAIPDEIFTTVLEYFEGCKGMAREQLLKKGMDVIRKREENEEATQEEAEESVEYKRARQLLQALPTET